jgi:hypothetical protein
MDMHRLTLVVVEGAFALCRLEAKAPLPSWATAGPLYSITRTKEELSIVCRQDQVPQGVPGESDWRCLRVEGVMPLSVVGVLASLTLPLAEEGISIFALSTFDTDYLLIKQDVWDRATNALRRHGHVVQAGEGPCFSA